MLAHITIIIAHSQPLLRLFLQNIFSSRPGICVAAIVTDAAGLLKAIASYRPDVIVADISLPGMPQLAALAQQEKPARVIFLWQYRHEPLLRKMINNTAGFIVEGAMLSSYFAAVKEVMKGRAYYCPQTEMLVSFLKGNTHPVLNEKYRLLLLCSLLNHTIQETAVCTRLKESTVKTYRKRLKKMIGSDSYPAIANALKRFGKGR